MGKEISRWHEWLIRSCIDIPWQQRRKVTVGFWENYDLKKKRKWSIPIIGHPNFIFQKNQREIVICHHYFFYLFLLFFIFSECCKSKVANISVFFYAYRVMGEDERKKRKKEAVSSGETTTISYCYHWWWENRKWDFWYNILRFLSCFPPFSFCYSNRARKHQISYHDSRGVENV
jgi:hypothetical protein